MNPYRRHRTAITRVFLLATLMMMALPVVHASHMAAALEETVVEPTSVDGAHDHHGHGDHSHCDREGLSAANDHSGHSDHHDHQLLHELMECDCLLCKVAQAPPLTSALNLPTLSRPGRDTPRPWVKPYTADTSGTLPPSRAPPQL